MHEMQSDLLKRVLLDVGEDLSIRHLCPACSASLGVARGCQAVCAGEDVGHIVLGTVPPTGQEAVSLVRYCCFNLLVQGWAGWSCRAALLRGHSVALSSILTPVQAGRDTFPALLGAPSRISS